MSQDKHTCSMECIGDKYCSNAFKQSYPVPPGPGETLGQIKTRTFPTGATRDVDNSKLDYEGFLSPFVLERFSQYMHECRLRNIPEGQTVRSSDNWQKGIPLPAYMKSMIRHVLDAWMFHRAHYGTKEPLPTPDNDKQIEDTLCAILFNVQGYLQELLVVKNAAYRPK